MLDILLTSACGSTTQDLELIDNNIEPITDMTDAWRSIQATSPRAFHQPAPKQVDLFFFSNNHTLPYSNHA